MGGMDAKPSRIPWILFALSIVATAAAGTAAWIGHQRATATVSELEDVKTELAAVEQARLALDRDLIGVKEQLAAVSARSVELEQSLESTEAELARYMEEAGSLEEKLQSEIAKGEIKVKQMGERIQVDLVDRVLFDSGEAALSPRGQEVLGRVAAALTSIDDKQIQVSGHTDDVPIKNEALKKQFPTNWELSTGRAVNVVRYLAETGGVKRERLTAAGYGEFHPIASNKTAAGRAKNRRIEILLTPTLDTKKKTAMAPAKPASP